MTTDFQSFERSTYTQTQSFTHNNFAKVTAIAAVTICGNRKDESFTIMYTADGLYLIAYPRTKAQLLSDFAAIRLLCDSNKSIEIVTTELLSNYGFK